MNRSLYYLYLIPVVGLFLYSFTQVDLSLTLSRLSVYQTIQKSFQYVGFYQRPLSTLIYIIIVVSLFAFYIYFLRKARDGKIGIRQIGIIIIVSASILTFSYNAFSYDLFNYIFDAKVLTYYHLNPYEHYALQFPQDPMLSFMRWNHRVYPYGPTWLLLTAPLSLFVSKIFLVTFFLFKGFVALSYLGSVYLIYKISQRLFDKEKIFNTVFFALNPLVLIEGLVSSHNDFPLIFFALLSIYLVIKKKTILSFTSLFLSIGVKFSTFVLIPVLLYEYYAGIRKKDIDWEKIFIFSVILSLIAVFLVTFRTTFQPWYLILPLSLIALVSRKIYLFVPAIVSSIMAVGTYTFYVYMTDYAKGYSQTITTYHWIALGIVILSLLLAIGKEKSLGKLL